MTAIVFYFQVHQPFRVRKDLSAPPIPLESLAAAAAESSELDPSVPVDGPGAAAPKAETTTAEAPSRRELEAMFDTGLDELVMRRVAERCYLPMNERLQRVIEETEGRFRCSFSISGTALDQMERWAPEALESFQRLAATDAVEFLGETSHHSLAALEDAQEFRSQVASHADRIEKLFGRRPTTFRNTELILDPRVTSAIDELGFDTILAEGAQQLLEGRSPHHLYLFEGTRGLRVIPRDWGLSDDIAFRFSNPDWESFPLFADAFAADLGSVPPPNEVLGLFMDYETFGEHQPAETGILEFMEHLPGYVLEDSRCFFLTPAELIRELTPADSVHVDTPVSWADEERDVSAWLGNPMQRDAHEALYRLLPAVRRLAGAGKPRLLDVWRRLSTSDHVYYMSTKRMSDGDVHSYFSPFDSPFASYAQFTAVLRALRAAIRDAEGAETEEGEKGS